MNFNTLISHELIDALGWTLLHSLWQGAVIAAVLAALLMLIPSRKANLRYIFSTALLGLTLAAFMVTFLWVLPAAPASQSSITHSSVPGNLASPDVSAEQQSDYPVHTVMMESGASGSQTENPEITAVARTKSSHALFRTLVLVWIIGVFIFSMRLLGGWLYLRRMQRRLVEPVSHHIETELNKLFEKMNFHRRIVVLQSTLAKAPATIGWLRPVILIPASVATGLPASHLQAVLAHELAHIRRHDYLVNLAQSFIETLLFYHPAVWWISSVIRTEREHSCDDMAVEILGSRKIYAKALTMLETHRSPFLAPAFGLEHSSLLARIARLCGRSPRKNHNRIFRAKAAPAGLFVLGTLLMVMGFLVQNNPAKAEDKPSQNQVEMAEDVSYEKLVQDLKGDEETARNAIQKLAESGGPEAAQAIVQQLDNLHPKVRIEAAKALYQLHEPSTFPDLIAFANKNTSREDTQQAVQAMAEWSGPEHIPVLEEFLRKGNHPLRVAALKTLKNLGWTAQSKIDEEWVAALENPEPSPGIHFQKTPESFVFTGPFQMNKPFVLETAIGTEEAADYFKINYLVFQDNPGNILEARLNTNYISKASARWNIQIELLDDLNEVIITSTREITTQFAARGVFVITPQNELSFLFPGLESREIIQNFRLVFEQVKTNDFSRGLINDDPFMTSLDVPESPGRTIVLPDGRLKIDPQKAWVKTDLQIEKGQVITLSATGEVHGNSTDPDDWAYGPWGPEGSLNPGTDHEGVRLCALVGMIKNKDRKEAFVVGPQLTFRAPFSGQLLLGVSDIHHFDNSGAFYLTAQVNGRQVDFQNLFQQKNPAEFVLKEQGQYWLQRMKDSCRDWLIRPVDEVQHYEYNFVQKDHPPQKVKQVNTTSLTGARRHGITYGSALHEMVNHPDKVIFRKIRENGDTVEMKFSLPDTFRTKAGNGLQERWLGYFSSRQENGTIVLNSKTGVPLECRTMGINESFSEYQQVAPGRWVPLQIKIEREGKMYFDWSFQWHEPGLWLLDKAVAFSYRDREPKLVCWTENIRINVPYNMGPFEGSQEIRFETGKSDGKQSYGKGGPMVEIDPSQDINLSGGPENGIPALEGIRVFGSYYGGMSEQEQYSMQVNILDESGATTLAEYEFPYSLFNYDPDWVSLVFPEPFPLPEKPIRILIQPGADQYHGIYFHYEDISTGSHSYAFQKGKDLEKLENRQWLVRGYATWLVGTETTVGQALPDSKGSTGDEHLAESEAAINEMFEPELLQNEQPFSDPDREKAGKSQKNKNLLENISIGGDVKVMGYMGEGIGPADSSKIRSRARIEAIYQANDNVSVGTTLKGSR